MTFTERNATASETSFYRRRGSKATLQDPLAQVPRGAQSPKEVRCLPALKLRRHHRATRARRPRPSDRHNVEERTSTLTSLCPSTEHLLVSLLECLQEPPPAIHPVLSRRDYRRYRTNHMVSLRGLLRQLLQEAQSDCLHYDRWKALLRDQGSDQGRDKNRIQLPGNGCRCSLDRERRDGQHFLDDRQRAQQGSPMGTGETSSYAFDADITIISTDAKD